MSQIEKRPYIEIGHKIKIAREEAGLYQKELAELIKTSASAVSYWENGIRNPYKYLEAIARSTKKSITWFYSKDVIPESIYEKARKYDQLCGMLNRQTSTGN